MKNIKLSPCPICNHILDPSTASSSKGINPVFNDITICFVCNTYLIYTKSLDLRKLLEDELMALPDKLRLQLHNMQQLLKQTDRITNMDDEPGLGDDIPCSNCGANALDTGLECTECGHDMRPEIYPDNMGN